MTDTTDAEHVAQAAGTPASDWYAQKYIPARNAVSEGAANEPPELAVAVINLQLTTDRLALRFLSGEPVAESIAKLLQQMLDAMRTWDDAEPSALDLLEEAIRGIPRNIEDAGKLVGRTLGNTVAGALKSVDLAALPWWVWAAGGLLVVAVIGYAGRAVR